MRIGNREGWVFAAVVAVVYGGLVFMLETAGSASAPTPLNVIVGSYGGTRPAGRRR